MGIDTHDLRIMRPTVSLNRLSPIVPIYSVLTNITVVSKTLIDALIRESNSGLTVEHHGLNSNALRLIGRSTIVDMCMIYIRTIHPQNRTRDPLRVRRDCHDQLDQARV